ncbi:cerebellar degeneration-related protein 2 [Microcaecilia unicolor]|uniref:Cerebellar degeneration-related protein 2 n=1 Tax=Microcaecilia unicolor TaxID=1415580 RepID=A0A6P7YVX5_9AMPH|nr:cerebellar degeneration-related protein 2 [Microcaecilia unicolor]
MLTDSIVEEFEIKDDEPWYDHQDLQQDLYLAAELGKTLLDRNTELEESLQQMYTTNQEQLQEIEYLTKQVELLRQVNEQHAKVYEQLDVTARDLEEANQKMVADSRASQHKMLSLTETIEGLQSQVEDLQQQVEDLKRSAQAGQHQGRLEQSKSLSVHSVSCLKELYDLRQNFVYDHAFAARIVSLQSEQNTLDEENATLRKTLSALQTQLNLERRKRKTIEEDYNLVLKENTHLEERLSNSDAYRARAQELEAEVAEMRQACQSENTSVSVQNLAAESFFLSLKDSLGKEWNPCLLEPRLTGPEAVHTSLKRSTSQTLLSSATAEEILHGHEETCIRRTEAVKQRGISLLNEVDAQYVALKVKYEELLQKCHGDNDSLSHKAVQTTKDCIRSPKPEALPLTRSQESVGNRLVDLSQNIQPEYKALFEEIFNSIRKTKEEIHEQRMKYKYFSTQP